MLQKSNIRKGVEMAIFGKEKNEQQEQAEVQSQPQAKPSVMSSAALLKKEATIPSKVIEDSLPKSTNDAKFSDLYIKSYAYIHIKFVFTPVLW